MLWTETMFHVKKPIIAMLHLDPLPGDPRWHYGDSVEAVVQHALEDLRALQTAVWMASSSPMNSVCPTSGI